MMQILVKKVSKKTSKKHPKKEAVLGERNYPYLMCNYAR
ncbi:hypothetical protein CPK_ORF00731 [Chlamydia pneumoniae LPCoLN]|nr:hypothetical protein CPK_ORF00731 [Chlamydia pneumoniae LPCoLN]